MVKPRGIPWPNIFLSFGGGGFLFSVSLVFAVTWLNDTIEKQRKRGRSRCVFFILI
jgi:hypothetical protein